MLCGGRRLGSIFLASPLDGQLSAKYTGVSRAAAAEHCNTTAQVDRAAKLPEGQRMLSHIKKNAEPWETVRPTRFPAGVRVNPPRKGGGK